MQEALRRAELLSTLYRSGKRRAPVLYGSADLILVEEYNNHRGRIEPAVILFRDDNTHTRSGRNVGPTYKNGGGKYDSKKDSTMEDCAVRELMEESSNLFRINSKFLENAESYVHYQTHQAFAIRVSSNRGIKSDWYSYNIELLKKNNAPHDWIETSDMKRFFISDFTNDLLTGPLDANECITVNDAQGTPRKIFGMTRACLRELVAGSKHKNLPLITLRENQNYQRGPPFLHGTKCYHD